MNWTTLYLLSGWKCSLENICINRIHRCGECRPECVSPTNSYAKNFTPKMMGLGDGALKRFLGGERGGPWMEWVPIPQPLLPGEDTMRSLWSRRGLSSNHASTWTWTSSLRTVRNKCLIIWRPNTWSRLITVSHHVAGQLKSPSNPKGLTPLQFLFSSKDTRIEWVNCAHCISNYVGF